MLSKGDKDVSDAACLREGGPAEAWGLSASILPLLDNTRQGQSQKQINPVGLDAGASLKTN